jgi:hypothetical protein
MEVLMALSHSLEDAAQQVAVAVQKWPAFQAQTITSTTIRNWRDQVRSPTDGRNPQFQQLRDHILGQLSPIAEVRKLLQQGPPGVPSS